MQTKGLIKQESAAMLPPKKWLTTSEAAGYLNMSRRSFQSIQHNFTISVVGQKKYYKVSELDKYIESNVIVNAV